VKTELLPCTAAGVFLSLVYRHRLKIIRTRAACGAVSTKSQGSEGAENGDVKDIVGAENVEGVEEHRKLP